MAISAFQSSVVHGLLQTAEYARAGHEAFMPRLSSDQIGLQIEAKLTRQRITRDNPPQFAVILDEAALHRMVGGHQVMTDQLIKVIDMSAWPNVTVQVLPFELGSGDHHTMVIMMIHIFCARCCATCYVSVLNLSSGYPVQCDP